MSIVDFESAETALKVFERMGRHNLEMASQLRADAEAKEREAKKWQREKEEYLQDLVISELLRRNLNCCTACGTITNEVALYYWYTSQGAKIWRLCQDCGQDEGAEFMPHIITAASLTAEIACRFFTGFKPVKILNPTMTEEVFRQLKEMAEREEQIKAPAPENLYHIVDN